MPMRILRLILAAALAATATQSARAYQQSQPLILLEDFRNDSATVLRSSRQELQNRLNLFREEVARERGRRLPFGEFEIRTAEDVERDVPQRLKRETLVVVWGEIVVDGDWWPRGTLYIGPSRVNSGQGVHNRFTGVTGRIYRRRPAPPELALYEIIIGYALLNRAWLEYPEAVAAIAQVLERRIEAARQGFSRSALTCLFSLRRAVRDIVARESGGQRPVTSRSRTPALQPIRC